MAIYPVERHGFVNADSWYDEYRRIWELFDKTLQTYITKMANQRIKYIQNTEIKTYISRDAQDAKAVIDKLTKYCYHYLRGDLGVLDPGTVLEQITAPLSGQDEVLYLYVTKGRRLGLKTSI
jgi:hypothetical protein